LIDFEGRIKIFGDRNCFFVEMANELAAIRQEVDAIRQTVFVVKEVIDIRSEVEAIRKEKDNILQQMKAQSNEAPKTAEKKPEPKKEEPKAAPAPKVEEKKPEPKKEQPKAAPAPKAAVAPKVEEKKPQAKAAAPVASGQPPKSQEWGRGDLLSKCCEGYYNLVRQDGADVNWVLLKHESNTKIRAEAVGTGGLSEVIPHLTEKDTGFVYMRFQTGDAESKRAKFVLFSFCGPRAPIMRKAKMSVHKADVKQIFASSALEIHATEASDFDEAAVRASLVRAGGANYNGQNQ